MSEAPNTMGDCWLIFNRNGFMLPESPLDPSLFPNAKRILEIEDMINKLTDELELLKAQQNDRDAVKMELINKLEDLK